MTLCSFAFLTTFVLQLFLQQPFGHAQAQTRETGAYRWIETPNPGKINLSGWINDGSCFLVVKDVHGQQFMETVEDGLCKQGVPTTYKWFGALNFEARWPHALPQVYVVSAGMGGACFEVDQATLGKQYKVKVTPEICPATPDGLTYAWLGQVDPGISVHDSEISDGHCYLVDKKTNGTLYQAYAVNDHCKEGKETVDKWFGVVKTLPELPAVPLRTFFDPSGEGGACYEVDRLSGGRQYKVPVASNFCRP